MAINTIGLAQKMTSALDKAVVPESSYRLPCRQRYGSKVCWC